MLTPIRSLYAIGRDASPAVLLSMMATTMMFTATPFLIGPVATHFGISQGAAGAISVTQVGVFAVVNLALPRLTAPSVALYRLSVTTMVAATIAGVFAPAFWILLVCRAFAGAAAGALTWIAWADAMRHERSMAAVSMAGPVAALAAAPLMAWMGSIGFQAVYVALAVVTAPGLLMAPRAEAIVVPNRVRSRSRSNRVLLVALALLTMTGSSLYVFESVAAVELYGMSPAASSIGFSLNAAAGILGARWSMRHRVPGRWMVGIAPAALLTIWGGSSLWFFVGMAWWGFAHWMALPGVLQMIAERSLARDERAGDAQALMAFGRSLGPALGGVVVESGGFVALALLSSLGTAAAGATVMGVQEGRERLPVSDPRVLSRHPG